MKATATTLAVLLAALLGVMTSAAAPAQDSTRLFGDWGGIRSALYDHGVDLQANYVNEVSSNPAGGAEHDTVYADQLFLGGTVDFQRAVGAPGSKLVFSVSNRNGDSLAAKAGLNTLLLVDEVWGQGSYTRLNQLYLEQALFGTAVDLKFGRMTGSGEFMPFSCAFQNQTFCGTLPAYVVPNWVPFPGSTWAGTLRVNFAAGLYLEGGAYEVNPAFREHQYTFALGKPFDGLGERYVLEGGWLPLGATASDAYRFGAWYDNVGGADLYFNSAGQPLATHRGTPLQRGHQGGFYAMAQQTVWTAGGLSSRSLAVFANFVQADSDVSLKDQIAEVGIFWKGPLSLRPQDEIGFAIGRVRVSDKVSSGEELFNSALAAPMGRAAEPVQRAEYPAELFYAVNVTPAVTFQPNIQVIHAPGGVASRTDVVVLGLKTALNF